MRHTIVHISEVEISAETGMGRIEYYWKQAFEKAGFSFVHIGPAQIKKLIHKSLFGFKAYRYYKQLKIKPIAFIAHEPVSGYFARTKIPCFVESHGIERRHWQEQFKNDFPASQKKTISLKTRILFPLWRLRACDKGLRLSHKLLLSNIDDKEYAKKNYRRINEDIFIFKNGFDLGLASQEIKSPDTFTILFNGSWLERKGIYTLIEAASKLYKEHFLIKYLLIGTGSTKELVLSDWPFYLRDNIRVVPHFKKEEEQNYLTAASLFVLPSYFEGQPLSLIQAMANAKCCISTDCCGQKDLINNGKDGFLFQPGNADELANIIEQCYLDPNLCLTIGNAAKEKLKQRSWDNVADEVAGYIISNINKYNYKLDY